MRELLDIIPDKGSIAFFTKKHNSIPSIEWVNIDDKDFKKHIDNIIHNACANKYDCYFTPAVFSKDDSGEYHKSKNLAKRSKTIFLDIDCHGNDEEDHYKTLDEAYYSFKSAYEFLNLSPNYIIYSGGGLQPVWILDSTVEINDWNELSCLLFDIFYSRKLKLDKNVRADASKMLRVPSTINTRWDKVVEIAKTKDSFYSPMILYNTLKNYADKYKVPSIINSIKKNNKIDPPSNTLSNDEYNKKLLQWMLYYIPSDFSQVKRPDNITSYDMWVRTIWAIKSTGLDNAWGVAEEWASKAKDRYNDWEFAFNKVWNTDNQEKDNDSKISFGSLLYIFRFYYPDKEAAKTYNFIKKEKTKVEFKYSEEIINPGAPNAELPYPFTHIDGRKGIFIIKESDNLNEFPKPPSLFVDRCIELLDIISPPPDYSINPSCLLHLLIHPSLYSDSPIELKIPTSTLPDEKALSKIFAAACVIPDIRNKWSMMSKYLQSLMVQYRNRAKNKFMVEQAGWNKNNTSFYLGSYNIFKDDANRAEISPNASVVLNGVGDAEGDVSSYLQLLNAFNTKDHYIQQAIILLMLGSPLCKFSAAPAATIYTYDRSTGTGKTFAHLVGLSFFGNPRYMMVGGDSTFNAINQSRMRYADIPLYIDEFKISLDKKYSSKGLIECKDFLLRSTVGKEKYRSSRDGQTFVSKSLYWNSPLFVSCNVPFSSLVESETTSQEATYARVMLIDYSHYMKNSPKRAYINGKDLEILLNENYGYIGRHYLKYVLNNIDYIKENVRFNYKKLNERSMAINKHNQHRFHNTTISAALTAIDYLEKFNLVPNWDLDYMRSFLPTLADTTNLDVSSLIVNDFSRLFTLFVSQQTNYTIETDSINDSPREIMLPTSKQYINVFHIVIFRKDELCWIKTSALKDFCKKYNADHKGLLAYMLESEEINAKEMTRVNFTKFAKNLNTDYSEVIVVPLKAVRVSLINNKRDLENKVVPIR